MEKIFIDDETYEKLVRRVAESGFSIAEALTSGKLEIRCDLMTGRIDADAIHVVLGGCLGIWPNCLQDAMQANVE